jgi:hypothetical protein
MALIVLFSVSLILVLINIEPFTFAGVLLSICYLPGLCLLALGKRDKLLFEDLLLAFPCSISICGLLSLGLLSVDIPVKYVPFIIHFITGIAVFLFIISKNKKKTYSFIGIDKHEILFCLFAFSMVLLLSIPYFIGPNRVVIANHAFHHSSFVSQILNGIFPPENPGLGGTKIGYYWGFHALIAAIASETVFHQLQIVFTLNAISLFMIFCIGYSFAKAFDISEVYRYIIPLAIIGLMRSDAGTFFIIKLFSGKLIPYETMIAQSEYLFPMDVLSSWIKGLPWLDTRLFYMNKFYNISAMPMAISLCLSYLLLLLLISGRRNYDKKIYLASLGIIISACALNYPPLFIVPLLHAPIWTFLIFLSAGGNFRDKTRDALRVLMPYAFAMTIALPYMFFIVASRDVSSSGQGEIFGLAFYSQSIKNITAFLIPIPLIACGVWIVLKKLSFSRDKLFILFSTALCLGLSMFTRWPFDNSYKFTYILVFFFSFLFVFALSWGLSLLKNQWVRRTLSSGVILFLLLNPVLVEAAYIVSCLSTDRLFTFHKGHIIYAKERRKNDAYSWIRENTPPESLMILSYVKTPFPCCGVNPIYEVAAIAERNLYVIKDMDYTISNPEYEERIRYRGKLFQNPDDPQVINHFTSLNRPVYLLVEKNLPRRFIVEERFQRFPENPGRPFRLVYSNDSQRVYLVKFSTGNQH